MKVAVIGGGSSYTPELVNGFLERTSSFPLSDLWLMDVAKERLEVVGRFAQRMVAAKGAPFTIHLTTDQREAVGGARYVITQLRVGGMQARRDDEYLGQRHGLIGQETTGVGGMSKALRTIPAILKVAADMRELAPGALLVNFTNPSGLITEALNRYAPGTPAVGVCNGPFTAKMEMLKALEEHRGIHIDPKQAELDVLVGHLACRLPFLYNSFASPNWSAGASTGATQSVPSLAATRPTSCSFATPHERRGVTIPAASCSLQPINDLSWRGRMLTMQGTPFQDALDRFGHIQPGTA